MKELNRTKTEANIFEKEKPDHDSKLNLRIRKIENFAYMELLMESI